MVAKSGWPVMGHRLVNSTVKLHEVVVARVLVLEGLQYRRVVVGRVLGMLVAEQGDAAGASLILIAASRGSGGSSRWRGAGILASQMGRDGGQSRSIHRSLGLPDCINIVAAKQRFRHVHWFHSQLFFSNPWGGLVGTAQSLRQFSLGETGRLVLFRTLEPRLVSTPTSRYTQLCLIIS